MFRPVALFALLLSALFLMNPKASAAQDGTVWVQVEALPDLASAQDRAQDRYSYGRR